jgi:hypothetical protein
MTTEQDKLFEAAEKDNQAAKSLIEQAKAEQTRVDRFRKEVLEAIGLEAAAAVAEALKGATSKVEACMVTSCGKATEPLTRAADLAGQAATRLEKSGKFLKTWAFYGPLYLILAGALVACGLFIYAKGGLGFFPKLGG